MEVAPGIRAKDIADGTVSANTAVAVLAAERQSIASDMRKAAAAAAGVWLIHACHLSYSPSVVPNVRLHPCHDVAANEQ
eukprot:m.1280480 g.1280480  ORF g.1280480 m.1280480 type:complete len:79 (-) comp24769_c0_seq4:1712-1948(-)